MRIAIYASAFHPSLGGVEEVGRQLAHALQKRGHAVAVWTDRWPRTLAASETYEDIPLHRFPARVPAFSWKARINYALTHRAIRARLIRQARDFRPDVVHALCVSTATWYAMQVAAALDVPWVAALQGELHMDASRIFQRSKVHEHIMRTALRTASVITACSRQTMDEAQVFHGSAFRQPTRVIYNGIDPREFADAGPHRHPRPYVFAIGRHVREKGFDVLLRAFARAPETGHDLVLAGAGTESDALKALAEELGIGGRVHFTGRLDHTAAVRFFKGCSFFVLPSRHEPFGIVNLEAMAAGKPVIASRVGGVPEIVEDGESGFLVPAEDEVALSLAMRRLAADAALRARMGEAGRLHAGAFGWDHLVEDYLAVYHTAKSEHARTGGVAARPGRMPLF